MKLKIISIFLIALTFSSCKSKTFVVQQKQVEKEVTSVFTELIQMQHRKNAVAINVLNYANFINIDKPFLIKTKAKTKALNQLGKQIQENGLSKKSIINYFKAQNELEKLILIVFEKIDETKESKHNNYYFELRTSYEKYDNVVKFTLSKYNTLLDKNKVYINFPKKEIK